MKEKVQEFQAGSDFFKKNERNQNLLVLRISYYTPLAGIAMIIGAFAGVFGKGNYRPHIILTAMLCLQSLCLKIFCKVNPEHPGIKYFAIISTELVVFFLTISKSFSPFIIYALAPLVSCIYFNKRFCFFASTMSYAAMIISIIIRSLPENPLYEGLSSFEWRLQYGLGLTFEYILNIGVLYLMSLKHLDALNENLTAIETLQKTQDELISGYSELVFQAHQSRKVNVKRSQTVVAALCEILANHDGFPGLKDPDICNAVISAVPLHDIGLIGVADAVVAKNTAFTDKERLEYQKHVVYGEELIRKNFYLSENREFLKIARLAALHHHEHWDGSGYPEGLFGSSIPVSARIIAAADELEVRVSGDNEHPAVSFETAMDQIQKLSGTVLDPVVVEALLSARISLEALYTSAEGIQDSQY